MNDITNIPLLELLRDRDESIADRATCLVAAPLLGMDKRLETQQRAETNRKIILVIEQELTRRGHPFAPFFEEQEDV